MTASLTIILLSQTGLLLGIYRRVHDHRRETGFWLTLAALVLLPLCFGPIVTISHIVFQVTPEWMFWVFLVLAGGLIVATLVSIVARAGHVLSRPVLGGLWLATACNMLILLIGIPMHGHESGPTPDLTDSPYFVFTWVTASLAVASIIWTIFWQAEPRSFARFVLVPALLAALVIELASSF